MERRPTLRQRPYDIAAGYADGRLELDPMGTPQDYEFTPAGMYDTMPMDEYTPAGNYTDRTNGWQIPQASPTAPGQRVHRLRYEPFSHERPFRATDEPEAVTRSLSDHPDTPSAHESDLMVLTAAIIGRIRWQLVQLHMPISQIDQLFETRIQDALARHMPYVFHRDEVLFALRDQIAGFISLVTAHTAPEAAAARNASWTAYSGLCDRSGTFRRTFNPEQFGEHLDAYAKLHPVAAVTPGGQGTYGPRMPIGFDFNEASRVLLQQMQESVARLISSLLPGPVPMQGARFGGRYGWR